MTPLEIFIPGKPFGKERPRATMRGHVYTPAKTRAKETEIAAYATVKMIGKALFVGPLRLHIDARMPGKATSRPDADNIGKLVMDALNGVVWGDDASVVDLRVTKRHAPEPGTSVRVEAA